MSAARPGRRLSSRVVAAADVTPAQCARMHELMSDHFENVAPPLFERDLRDKDWVVAMEDQAGTIQGFTTIKVIELEDEGEPILVFYSGDTVLAPEYWGENGWLTTWARLVIQTAENRPEARPFWVLLTATHRTYGMLAASFQEYGPNPDAPTPPRWQRIVDTVVAERFPGEYDPKGGVVRLTNPTPVRRPEEIEALIPGHDPKARFFCERNPGYLRGDFLVCVTEMSRANATKIGLRVLGLPAPTPSSGS